MATRLPQKISELQGDVHITSPTDGQVLKYDAASGKWVDATDEVNSASEMLAELLTVDGTGSGLDADKLDGQEGSYYASNTDLDAHTDASNPHTGSASNTDLDAHTDADNPHSGSASNTDLDAHIDADNPHSGSASDTDLDAHVDDTDNPHGVTASQVTLAIRSVTTATTLASTDGLILAGGTSDYTIALPAASTVANKVFYIKKTSTESYTLTIDGNGTETIDGNTTVELVSQYDTLTIISDGSNWYII